jgi:hypothetical protein
MEEPVGKNAWSRAAPDEPGARIEVEVAVEPRPNSTDPAGRAPPPADEEPPPPWRPGRNPLLGLNVQPPVTALKVRQCRELGVRHIRSSVWWAWYNPAVWSEFMPRLREAGIEVMPIITAPPENRWRIREAADRTAEFTVRFLDRFPVSVVQLGNEWDGLHWFQGGTLVDVGRRYGTWLHRVSERVRGAHPGVRIVTMGAVNTLPFAQGVCETGHGAFDTLAIHVYGVPLWHDLHWGTGRRVRGIMNTAGLSRTPLWCTEFGMNGGRHAISMQQNHGRYPAAWELDKLHLESWQKVLDENETRDAFDRVYGFQLDPGEDPAFNQLQQTRLHWLDYGYGLVRADGLTPRPAYEWLRKRRYNGS